ncbi:MAG: rod shape-determining protein MreC [Bacteroidetes bacterium]|nr:rod shape-determining protein MreC [Bacteroidota bacterium]
MQNLFAFLIRFRVFLGFLVLQTLSFLLYFQFVTYPRSVFFTGAAKITGQFLSWENDLYNYFQLSAINEALQQENAQLRGVSFDNYYQLQRPTIEKNDTLYQQSFRFIPAKVISAPVDRRNNYFTINAGNIHGIKKGMGVISDNGIVGVVFKVGENYSLIKSVLTSDINIDVIIGKKEIRGILKWNGMNPRIGSITGVSTDVNIPKWSEVRTQGSTGIFPKGLLLGKVQAKERIENQSLWDIRLLFKEDLKNVHCVYIVNSLIIDELEQLQQSVPKDNLE